MPFPRSPYSDLTELQEALEKMSVPAIREALSKDPQTIISSWRRGQNELRDLALIYGATALEDALGPGGHTYGMQRLIGGTAMHPSYGAITDHLRAVMREGTDEQIMRLLSRLRGSSDRPYPVRRYGLLSTDRPGSAALLDYLAENTDFVTRRGKFALMEDFLEANNAVGLAYGIEHQWLRRREDKVALLDMSRQKKDSSPECRALLMTAYATKEKDKSPLSLSLDDNQTVEELRRSWSFRRGEDGNYIITGYKGEERNVTVPEKIGKVPVTAIAPGAFNPEGPRVSPGAAKRRAAVTSLTIPGTIKSVPNELFRHYLEKKDHATTVSLRRVTLCEGVERIGAAAFANCGDLEEAELPQSLKAVGSLAFAQTGLVEVAIPDHARIMADGVFAACRKLEQVSLPGNLRSIPPDTFRSCVSLRKMDIPATVTSIGAHAFDSCPALTSMDLPDSLKSIGPRAFMNCRGLAGMRLPDSLESIGPGAFTRCKSLASIHIPDGVTRLEPETFRDCLALADIRLPDGIGEIGEDAFSGCRSLTGIRLPNGLRAVGSYAFSDCSRLKAIEIPDGVTRLEPETFHLCSALEEVHLPGGITEMGTGIFNSCSSLKAVSLPDGLESVAPSSFFGCRSLSSVHIPESVKTIEQAAFMGCRALAALDLPDGLESVGHCAFEDCVSLSSIRLPESTRKIGSRIFMECRALEEVHLPDRLATIPEEAFCGCASLGSIELPKKLRTIGKYAFGCCGSLASIDIPDRVRRIGPGAFEQCDALQQVRLPEGVAKIENGVFRDCGALREVAIPDSVAAIDTDAFAGCRNLEQVRAGAGLREIHEGAFYECGSLRSVSIPDMELLDKDTDRTLRHAGPVSGSLVIAEYRQKREEQREQTTEKERDGREPPESMHETPEPPVMDDAPASSIEDAYTAIQTALRESTHAAMPDATQADTAKSAQEKGTQTPGRPAETAQHAPEQQAVPQKSVRHPPASRTAPPASVQTATRAPQAPAQAVPEFRTADDRIASLTQRAADKISQPCGTLAYANLAGTLPNMSPLNQQLAFAQAGPDTKGPVIAPSRLEQLGVVPKEGARPVYMVSPDPDTAQPGFVKGWFASDLARPDGRPVVFEQAKCDAGSILQAHGFIQSPQDMRAFEARPRHAQARATASGLYQKIGQFVNAVCPTAPEDERKAVATVATMIAVRGLGVDYAPRQSVAIPEGADPKNVMSMASEVAGRCVRVTKEAVARGVPVREARKLHAQQRTEKLPQQKKPALARDR